MEKQNDFPPLLIGDNGKVYEFIHFIARGGYGTVVKVQDKCGGFFAIKSFLTKHDSDDQEFQAFQKTSNIENVVKAFSMFKTEYDTHIVMEMLEGGDLWDNLYDFGPMPRLQAISIFRKLVITVAELLRAGLYPCDLKAENLYYDRSKKTLKIMDLGGLKDMRRKKEVKKEDGTLCFYPPEYHLQERKQDIKYWKENGNIGEPYLSWMLGLILWHLLVGEQKCINSLEDIKFFKLEIPSKIHGLQESETYHLVIELLSVDPAKRLKFWSLHQKLGISSRNLQICFIFSLLFYLLFPQDVQISIEQGEVEVLVSKIDKLQAKYWSGMKKENIFVVDTSYLLARHKLPVHSTIIVPFQVVLELRHLKKKIAKRVKNVLKTLENKQNIFYQSAETKKIYQSLFHVKSQDKDGYILATALFLKVNIPFRKVIVLSKDKELNLRCKLLEVDTITCKKAERY